LGVKTAISLPDDIFAQASQRAAKLGSADRGLRRVLGL